LEWKLNFKTMGEGTINTYLLYGAVLKTYWTGQMYLNVYQKYSASPYACQAKMEIGSLERPIDNAHSLAGSQE
jgi:hypothetical protein